jgi:DNA-binding NarL/FixJ family response regulator
MADTIHVAIIEDRREIRAGLAALIGGTEGFRCADVFASMEDALPALAERTPDVVLVDIGLPGMSGIEGLRLLRARHPALPLVMLTVYDDDERIFDALCAGASGYLLKKTAPSRLIESLREAAEGGALFRELRPPARADYDLTPHERRILGMLVEGHNYKTAAVALGVSVNTISFHVRHVYEKLQVHSRSDAVAKALRERIVG